MDFPYRVTPTAPARDAFPITPSDQQLARPARALYVGTTGNLELTLINSFSNIGILPSAVNLTASTITVPQHEFKAGDRVMIGSTEASPAIPGGLAAQTAYYVLVVDTNTIQLSATNGGAAITLTSQGAGVLSVFKTTFFNAVAVGEHPYACKQVNGASTASNLVGLL